jgi:DNA-binding MarR family transcriptional regulator
MTLLATANRQATLNLKRVLAGGGVPIEQWRVLELLADEQERTMSGLAAQLQMKLPSLSKLIDRMVGAALVQRAPDPLDQRRVVVYVTDLGLERYRTLRRGVQRRRRRIEDALSPADAARLRGLLEAFIAQQPH